MNSSVEEEWSSMSQHVFQVKHKGRISLVISDFQIWVKSQDYNAMFNSEVMQLKYGKDETLKFRLQLELKKNDPSYGLYLMSQNDQDLRVDFACFILGRASPELNQGKKRKKKSKIPWAESCELVPVLERKSSKKFKKEANSWGFANFIPKKTLCEKPSVFLPGASLTLRCDFFVYKTRISTSDKYGLDTESLTSTLLQDMKSLWKNPVFPDFALVSGQARFPCHKIILSLRSEVFKKDFAKNDEVKTQANFDHLSPKILSKLLEFIYTDTLEDKTGFNCTVLLQLAHMLQVQSLVVNCEKALSCSIDYSNAIRLMSIAASIHAPTLMSGTAEFIASHRPQLVGSEDWKAMVQSNPRLMEAVFKFGKN